MLEMADGALKLADMRTLQDQTRMMEAYGLETECTAEEWSKIVSILDIVNGTQSADLVKRRWHSAREETADLEAARLAAQRDEIKMCAECFVDEPVSKMTAPDSRYPNIYVCKGCLPLVVGKELRLEGEKGTLYS